MPVSSSLTATVVVAFIIMALGVSFWGYPLGELHFSDFHFYEKELPPLWGLSLVDPHTKEVSYAFLAHNEGLMALVYHVFHELPLDVERKVVLVNATQIGLQLTSAVLLAFVLRSLVGPQAFPLFLMLALLYPFASANRYWEACLANNLAAALFLASLMLFLKVDYQPGRLVRNLALFVVPSLVLLWLSIITVEFALCMSPLYVYLALYYSNGKTAVLRFPKLVTRYSMLACLFLLTSILPLFLFTGHRLTVASYALRYRELAEQVQGSAALLAVATVAGNALLTYLSYGFANTLGLLLYPLTDLAGHPQAIRSVPLALYGLMGATLVVGWLALRSWVRWDGAGEGAHPDYRFLLVLGGLWMILAYVPFSLSYGYPRNVGLTADRINVLGAWGSVLCLGSLLGVWLRPRGEAVFYGSLALLGVLWMLTLQFQKAQYLETGHKEQALVQAVLEEDAERRTGREVPIFLFKRAVDEPSPRARLRQALVAPDGLGKVLGVTGFLVERYFTGVTVSTDFHLNGLFFFWCCPASAPTTFNFHADRRGVPRPLVYKWEEPFRLAESPDRYRLGYLNTEVWQPISAPGEFQEYDKRNHHLVVMDIAESTFQFGAPSAHTFNPYRRLE